MKRLLTAGLVLSLLAVFTWSARAEACGCFAPSNNTLTPVVQAGERILFAVRDGKVLAHIQIQYAGDAQEFGWLLPLPAVPKLEVGRDELFAELQARTQPTYAVTTVMEPCARQSSGGAPFLLGCASPTRALSSGGVQENTTNEFASPPPVAVVQASVGPFDYAVLDASNKQAMVQWLNDNRYFIPTANSTAVDPYIRPGSYFLALKLRSGKSAGDITPIVLEYPSAYPMIPLVLTSVGAQPNMGVQVWMLGAARAVPRNYHHVVLNDAQLAWGSGLSNYSSVVTAAVAEAPQKHAFVTEYAGASALMQDVLADEVRFGSVSELAASPTPGDFVRYLFDHRYADATGKLPATVMELLNAAFPVPTSLSMRGVTQAEFVTRLDYYLGDFKAQNPDLFANVSFAYEPTRLATGIFAAYVKPMQTANALFREFPVLTRLYTTISPQDMTEDPVFAFNPDLPLVPLAHAATVTQHCDGHTTTQTAQGWSVSTRNTTRGPAAMRVEVLHEEGAAVLVTDNSEAIGAALTDFPATPAPDPTPMQGCTTVDPLTMIALTALVASRRRSRRA